MKTPVDRLEEFLSECGHQTWGFVIYRVVYDSSSGDNFASFLSNIKASASQSLEFYGADEWPIAQQISWTVVEDRALDGASKVEVRRRFDEWCQSAEAASEQPSSRHPIAQSYNARYRFCVVIDRSSLDSAETRKPWVNVIMRNWPLTQRVGPGSGDEVGDEEEGEDDDEDDDYLPEDIEGCTDEDVGWCKVKVLSLVPSSFATLCNPNAWYHFYQRPPVVV